MKGFLKALPIIYNHLHTSWDIKNIVSMVSTWRPECEETLQKSGRHYEREIMFTCLECYLAISCGTNGSKPSTITTKSDDTLDYIVSCRRGIYQVGIRALSYSRSSGQGAVLDTTVSCMSLPKVRNNISARAASVDVEKPSAAACLFLQVLIGTQPP